MHSMINKDVLQKIYDSDKFNREIYDFISKTLDDELLKDESEMDCDLICWCTNSLIELEKESDAAFDIIIPLFTGTEFKNASKRLNFKSLSKGSRALIAACLTMFFAISANAAVDKIFDYNIAENIVSAISERINANSKKDIVIGEDKTTVPADEKGTYTEGEKTDEKKPDITGVTGDKKVTQSDAVRTEIKENTPDENKEAPAAVVQNVTVTSIQGEPPEKLIYTTQDTSLDLSGLRLRYVYSDGTYSKWFGSERAKIKNNIDFNKASEQEVILIIDNAYEYSYKILVKSSEIKDDKIKSVKLGHTGLINFTFLLNEQPDLSKLHLEVTYLGGKSEKIYYNNCDEMAVVGINTSIETFGNTKQFTVYYKGFTVTADYVVKNRNNEIYKTDIIQYGGRYALTNSDLMQTPKTLYYYGEPLSVGKGINPNMQNDELVSCNAFADNDKPINNAPFTEEGFTVRAKNVSGEGYVFYDSDELDIFGYDPYKLGFQTLDVYYNGMYLFSYNVFVYGDDGFCPSNTVDAFVDYGEGSQLKINGWYRCIGNGRLQSSDAYFNEICPDKADFEKWKNAHNDSVYNAMKSGSFAVPDNSEQIGWQNAVCTFNEDYSYELKLCQRYDIYTYEINYGDADYFEFDMSRLESPDFGNATITLKIKNVGDVTYNINDFRTVPRIIRDGYSTGSVIDTSLELESAFVNYQIMFDRNSFRLDNRIGVTAMIPAFVYEEGFEDSIVLDVRSRSSYDEDIYDINESEQSLADRYDYYLAARNNNLRIANADNYIIRIKDVAFGTAGEYDGVLYTEYNSRVLEAKRHYTIVEKLVSPKLEVIYDENKSRVLLPGDKFVVDNTLLIYTNKKGDKQQLSAKDIGTSMSGVDDWGYISASFGEDFLVDYKYNGVFTRVWYTCWGKVNTLNATYVKSYNGVRVTFKDSDYTDYYEIKCGDAKIITSDKYATIDKAYLKDGQGFVSVTPHIIVNGEDIAGVTSSTSFTYSSKW